MADTHYFAASAKYDQRQRQAQKKLAARIRELFTKMCSQAARIGLSTRFSDPEKPFYLRDFPQAEKAIEKLLRSYSAKVEYVIDSGVKDAWKLSGEKNGEMARSLLSGKQAQSVASRRSAALEAFRQRRVNGMGLSERVWDFVQHDKQMLEMALEVGMSEGRSAQRLSRDVRSYLTEPKRLFRRVRDRDGNLRLSKAAAAYHPGQGVYRSSYKNALRLAITETNMAYRKADSEAWRKMPYVIGIIVELSKNHTTKDAKGRTVELRDICDELAGEYPKDFEFTGWHPHCRCYAKAKLADKDEINKWAKMSDEERAKFRFSGTVEDVPDNFSSWVEKNSERAKNWSSLPYFLRDNEKYAQGIQANLYDSAEKTFVAARRTTDSMKEAVGSFAASNEGMTATEAAAICHFTRGDISAYRRLNNKLRKGGKLSQFESSWVTLMDRGLEKIAPVEAVTYRTMRLNKGGLNKWIGMADSQAETTFTAYSSSSYDRGVVEEFAATHLGRKKNERDVLLVVKGKSGRPIEKLSQFGGLDNGKPNQREVLFMRGKRFRVLSYRVLEGSSCAVEFTIEEI